MQFNTSQQTESFMYCCLLLGENSSSPFTFTLPAWHMIWYYQPVPPCSTDLMRKLEERVLKTKCKYVTREAVEMISRSHWSRRSQASFQAAGSWPCSTDQWLSPNMRRYWDELQLKGESWSSVWTRALWDVSPPLVSSVNVFSWAASHLLIIRKRSFYWCVN